MDLLKNLIETKGLVTKNRQVAPFFKDIMDNNKSWNFIIRVKVEIFFRTIRVKDKNIRIKNKDDFVLRKNQEKVSTKTTKQMKIFSTEMTNTLLNYGR